MARKTRKPSRNFLLLYVSLRQMSVIWCFSETVVRISWQLIRKFSIESWNWVIWVYVGFGWLQFVVDLQTFFYLSRQLDAIAPRSLAFSWALVSLFEYSLALGDIFFCSDCDYFSFTTLYRNALNNFKWFFSHVIFLRIWGLRSLGK